MSKKPLLLQALKGETIQQIPIWFMRQAGRYLTEYNQIRAGRSFMELCQNPELAAEVSLQPYHRFQVDGIIMFSDILTPLHGAGVPLHFEEKVGPVLEKTITTDGDLKLLENYNAEQSNGYVRELLTRLRGFIDALPSNPPALLGFAGAPFTLASYLIEGGTSRKFEKTKEFVFGHSKLFHRLSERITEISIEYLTMQLQAGADVVQLFDSWAGILSVSAYEEFAAPYTQKIIRALNAVSDKPVILFVGNSAHLLGAMSAQSPQMIGLDWRVTPEEALRLIPSDIALQGNLDPLVLYGTPEVVRRETRKVLDGFAARKGYVFNLGHGIHPRSPIACVEAMIQMVRNYAMGFSE